MEDLFFLFTERLQQSIFIVNHTHGGREAQLHRARGNGQRVLGVFNSAADDRIDVDVKVRMLRSEEHTSELQSRFDLVCRLLLEKKKKTQKKNQTKQNQQKTITRKEK